MVELPDDTAATSHDEPGDDQPAGAADYHDGLNPTAHSAAGDPSSTDPAAAQPFAGEDVELGPLGRTADDPAAAVVEDQDATGEWSPADDDDAGDDDDDDAGDDDDDDAGDDDDDDDAGGWSA